MNLLRAFLLHRLTRGSRGRHSRYGGGYGRHYGRPGGYGRHGYGRRRQSSGFRFFGPVPMYSRRTRGGGRVSVGGCCLPIPLALTLGTVAGAGRYLRR
jgi:hypothetical protein